SCLAPGATAEISPSVPSVAMLGHEIDRLASRYAIRPRRLTRLRSGLSDSSERSRLPLWKAIQVERAALELRARFDTYDASAYKAGEAAAARKVNNEAPPP